MKPVTISKASEISFRKLYKCDSTIIFNGIAKPVIIEPKSNIINVARITPHTTLLFHAGRIDKVKNQLMLCECVKRLNDEGRDIVLIIAGKNQYADVYSQILPYFSDRIRYIGEHENVPQLMSECDAMCLSSVYEGLPVTLLEALATGCVPICTPVGGIVDVIQDGVNGILSSSVSASDYYIALKRFVDMEVAGRCFMKSMAKRSYNEYTIEKSAKQYLKLYSK